MKEIKSFKEFWPFYLGEHRHPVNRALHYVGTSIGVVMVALAILRGRYWLLLFAPVIAYGCAWTGHFLFEKNRPATFTYPLKSFFGDFVMLGKFLAGRLKPDLDKLD